MNTSKDIVDKITWQPIETAPKNVKVLAAYQNELGNWRIVTACYHTQLDWSDEYGDHEEDFAPEAWYEENDSSEVIYPTSRVPTHWMPLPSNPGAPDDNIVLSALADAERERDEANERCAAAVEDYNVQLAGHRLSAKQATENLLRATAAESTLSSQAALLEEARKVATKLSESGLGKYIRTLVAGWDGENRPEHQRFGKHPKTLGSTIPTTAGDVYDLDEAIRASNDLLSKLEGK